MNILKASLVGALLATSTGALAADSSFFFGGGLSADGSDFDQFVEDNAPVATTNFTGGLGAEVYAGAQLNQYVDVRLGYKKFGQQSADIVSVGPDPQVTADLRGLYLAADALYPLTDKVGAGLTLGYLGWHSNVDYDGSKSSDSGNSGMIGLMARLTPADANYSFDLSWQAVKIKPGDSTVSGDVTFATLAAALTVKF